MMIFETKPESTRDKNALPAPGRRLIPVSLIAVEIGTTVDELVVRLAEHVTVNDIGIRCLSANRAALVITGHYVELQAAQERDAAYRAQMATWHDPARLVRALRRGQQHRAAPATPDMSAGLGMLAQAKAAES